MRRGAWLLAVATAGLGACARAQTFDFVAMLDGKAVGTHRFVVEGEPGARSVDSRADFDVRFLGLRVYRYRHHAAERWRGDCLQAMDATTDDDGRVAGVRVERTGESTRIGAGAEVHDEPGCVMSFAYWNPAIRTQSRLLNPQTGKLEAVRVEKLADGSVQVGGKAVAAAHWRIEGAAAPIDLWYSAAGEWIGLDSVVGGSHRLSYRLP